MKDYYEFWEDKVYRNLYQMTIHNLNYFNEELNKNRPIFQVDAILAEPEIMLRPISSEVYNIIVRTIKDFLSR